MANISSFFPGGGAGTPIGGFAYIVPQAGTTFTAGQEVYTDPNDSTVWIRAGAQITEDGSGALDASIYRDAEDTLIAASPENTAYNTTHIRNDRYGIDFDGKNVLIVGYNGSDCDIAVFDVDGTSVVSPTDLAGDLTTSASVFYNSTHTFIMERWIANTGTVSIEGSAVDVKYIQTSTLTSLSAYKAAGTKWLAPTSPNPTSEQLACVTNAGLSSERHWWGGASSKTLAEFTFDNTTAAGSVAWTSTGNSITLPANPLKITADGNEIFVHTGTTVYVYNATTRSLTKTIPGAPAGYVEVAAEVGLFVIPASYSNSGNQELWFPNHDLGTSSFGIDFKQFEFKKHITGPYTGTFNSREEILLKDIDAGATFGADSISAGDGGDDNIYLWKRIA